MKRLKKEEQYIGHGYFILDNRNYVSKAVCIGYRKEVWKEDGETKEEYYLEFPCRTGTTEVHEKLVFDTFDEALQQKIKQDAVYIRYVDGEIERAKIWLGLSKRLTGLEGPKRKAYDKLLDLGDYHLQQFKACIRKLRKLQKVAGSSKKQDAWEMGKTWTITYLNGTPSLEVEAESFVKAVEKVKDKLSYANLGGVYLRNADLGGADLSYANLSAADLSYASLKGADLFWADLSGANLKVVNLDFATLDHADLGYGDLTWASLKYVYLRGANLRGADLSGADLSGANLEGAKGLPEIKLTLTQQLLKKQKEKKDA